MRRTHTDGFGAPDKLRGVVVPVNLDKQTDTHAVRHAGRQTGRKTVASHIKRCEKLSLKVPCKPCKRTLRDAVVLPPR